MTISSKNGISILTTINKGQNERFKALNKKIVLYISIRFKISMYKRFTD